MNGLKLVRIMAPMMALLAPPVQLLKMKEIKRRRCRRARTAITNPRMELVPRNLGHPFGHPTEASSPGHRNKAQHLITRARCPLFQTSNFQNALPLHI